MDWGWVDIRCSAGQPPVVKERKRKSPWIGCGVLQGLLPVGSILLASALIRSDVHICFGGSRRVLMPCMIWLPFVFSLYPVSFVCMASPGFTSSLIDVTSFHYPLSIFIIQSFYFMHHQCTQNCNWISQSKLYGIVIPHPNMIPLPTPLHMHTQHQDWSKQATLNFKQLPK